MEQHSNNNSADWNLEEEEKGFDIKLLVNKALVLWPWMILGAILMGCLSLTYLYFTTPTYKITAKILIKDDDKKSSGAGLGDVSMLQSIGLLSGASSVDNELEIITSYTLMYKVVNDLQLNVVTYNSGALKTIELYGNHNPFSIEFLNFNDPILLKHKLEYSVQVDNSNNVKFIEKLDSGEKTYNIRIGEPTTLLAGRMILNFNKGYIDSKAGKYKIIVTQRSAITKSYMEALTATIPNKQVSTIALSLSEAIPSKGEKIINTLIQEYMQANVDDNNRIADSTMSFIDGRLLVVGDQLTDIEKQIQGFKQQNQLADLTEQSKALIQNTSDYVKQVADQEVILNVIESLEKYLNDNSENPRIVPASLLVQDPTLTGVIQQYNNLLMQRSRLLLATTETNPMVQNLDGQIKDLRSDLIHAMASVKRSAQVALSSVKGNAGQIQAQLKQVPAKERVFLDYSRQQQIRQELYLFLLQKREETAISRSSTIANARIIDAAKSDEWPFKPKKKMIFGAAILLGILIPFGVVYLRDVLNTKIKTKADIESETKIPILGEIGHNDESNFIVVTRKSRSLVAEQFRALRANLQFLFTNKEDNVIMMTSSMSGEGKSFIATNIAMVFALADKKVVLLELDLRKPKIMSSLEMKFDKGFSQYAIGAATLDEIIYPSGLDDNLFIIPAGPIPPNPSELILHERTEAMFAELKKRFDYVIIDTTPNLVSDAQLLSVHANATLYVARLDYTHKEQLRIPERLQKQGKLPKLNLIINDIKPKRHGGGYYGYGYGGYGYGGYGYGYGEYVQGIEKKKKKLFGSKKDA